MRPLRLVVKGFGTYLEEQDLDFSLLRDKNIFVITGDTGVGKTTVFDAINYALYGEASGEERKKISFRSDFATAEEETKVELWFALRDKEYYVKREPSYMQKKLRGEGEKEHKAYAELLLPDGKVITGISQVTAEVEKILGINQEQFRQIVMIPQGEFKKLLTADSQDREKIFRKIFGTAIFDKIQNKVNNEANELDKEVKFKRNERDAKLLDFDCQETDEELFRIIQSRSMNLNEVFMKAAEVIKKDHATSMQMSEDVKAVETTIEILNKELVQGENINKKFEDLASCEKELKRLEDELRPYQEKRITLDKARKALTVKGFEEKWTSKKNTYNAHKQALDAATAEHITLKEKHDKSTEALQAQKVKESERKELEKGLNEAEKLKVKAQKYDSSKEKALEVQKEADNLKMTLDKLSQTIDKNEATIKSIELTMEKVVEAEKDKIQLENMIKEITDQDEALDRLKVTLELVQKQKAEHSTLGEKFNAFDKNFEEVKVRYEIAEESFRRGQAGLLAQSLRQSMPCPVCGSLEHPHVAILLDETINEEAVDRAKTAYEAARVKRDEYFNKLTELNTNITLTLSHNVKPLALRLLGLEEISNLQEVYVKVSTLIECNSQLIIEKTKSLNIAKQLVFQKVSLLASKDTLSREITLGKEAFKQETEKLTVKGGELSAAKEQLRMIEEEFEGKVRTYGEITVEMAKMQSRLELLISAYQEAEDNHNKQAKALGEVLGKLMSINSNIEVATKEKEEAAEIFKDNTLALGFADFKEYKAFCKEEEEIDNLDKNIQQFDARFEGAKRVYEKARAELKDLQPIQLQLIKEKRVLATEQKNGAVKAQQILFARMQNNVKVLKEAKVLSEKIAAKEQRYEIVGELAKVMKGDNTYRISFERYVLAAYFDDIVEASNIKFSKMTGNRFELLRKTQKGDARSQQGLDLEVMDNYTGKARPVETLSGGESFKASLAMALGLADVVQSYAGGIQLDTMFVDEGFGTLDPESLESAIACLVGLQKSGRLVGIISHVPELKERIDVRLEVTRIARGSRAIFKL